MSRSIDSSKTGFNVIYCTWKWLCTDGVEILSAEKGIATRQTRMEETFKVAAVNNRGMTGATTVYKTHC